MTRARRILLRAVVVVVVLSLVLGLFVVWTVRRSFPTASGEITLAALDAPVTVHRDRWGVPHVFGDSMVDLVRAQGYVHAQDRFWEMDVRRHVTAGRLSELFGEDQLDTDRFVRTLGWRRTADAELALISDETRTLLEAYAEGVNAYLEQRKGARLSFEYAVLSLSNRGYEPEPWVPADSLAWLKAMAWDLRSNLRSEVERAVLTAHLPVRRIEELYPAFPEDRHPTILGADMADRALQAAGLGGIGLGSNSWVVGGEHTSTGAPLLANDPHLEPSLPGIWHQIGLHCNERSEDCPLDVVGFGFSGVPGVVIGHNDRIAWGFTNLANDVSDVYVEQVDGDRYRFEDGWRDLEVLTETIEVAGGEPVEIEIRRSHHGPLLSDASESLREMLDAADLPDPAFDGVDVSSRTHAVAIRWTALEPGRTADALFTLNVARDFDDFRRAASLFEVPAQNLLYADVDGHIGYQSPGRHPVRADRHSGRYPVPGWTGEHEWQAFVDFDDLPYVLDPQAGYIETANQPVTPSSAPNAFDGDFAAGFRGARIDQRLRELIEAGDVTLEQLSELQMDSRNLAFDILGDALRAVPVDGHTAEAVALLDGWDGQQTLDSAPGAYFAAAFRHTLLETFGDELPEDHLPDGSGRWWLVLDGLLDEPDADWWDDVTTDEIETRDDILVRALDAADAELRDRLGDDVDGWRWGDLHLLPLTHGTLGESGIGLIERLFNRGPVETSGSMSVVNATSWDASQGYEVTAVPSMRMLVDLADLDRSRWINLTGQSGHAYHGHYTDQVDLWRRGETTPMWFDHVAVEEAATDTLTLRPGD